MWSGQGLPSLKYRSVYGGQCRCKSPVPLCLFFSQLDASCSVAPFFHHDSQRTHTAIGEQNLVTHYSKSLTHRAPFYCPHVTPYWLDRHLEGRAVVTVCWQRDGRYVGSCAVRSWACASARVVWSLLLPGTTRHYQLGPLTSLSSIKPSQNTRTWSKINTLSRGWVGLWLQTHRSNFFSSQCPGQDKWSSWHNFPVPVIFGPPLVEDRARLGFQLHTEVWVWILHLTPAYRIISWPPWALKSKAPPPKGSRSLGGWLLLCLVIPSFPSWVFPFFLVSSAMHSKELCGILSSIYRMVLGGFSDYLCCCVIRNGSLFLIIMSFLVIPLTNTIWMVLLKFNLWVSGL